MRAEGKTLILFYRKIWGRVKEKESGGKKTEVVFACILSVSSVRFQAKEMMRGQGERSGF